MFTVTITYEDRIEIFSDVRRWEVRGRCFYLEYDSAHIKFLPIYKIIEIEVTRNN